MAVTHVFDGSILVLHLVGEYPPADVRSAFTVALEDPLRPAITGLLVDVTQSESIARRTLGEITSIIGFLVYHARAYGSHIALVASSDVAYGLVRMADVDLDIGGVQTRTFRDAGEAMRWLKR